MELSKAAALARVNGKAPGSFVIRDSDKSFAAISVVRPDGTLYHQVNFLAADIEQWVGVQIFDTVLITLA
jgi:hypothetical protein